MSYNGVGLSTPRGSGTNGHIQANRSHVRPREKFERAGDLRRESLQRAPDAAILDHERKRRVEVKCLELQMSLEDDGVGEDDIQNQVAALRASLLAQSAQAQGAERDVHSIKSFERHAMGQAKELANERVRLAMGIRADHVEGRAFDRDAQAQDKILRAEERVRQQDERRKTQELLALERERHRREMDNQRRRHQQELDDARRGGGHTRNADSGSKRERSSRSPPPRTRAKTPPGMRRIVSRSPSPPPPHESRARSPADGHSTRGRSLTRSPSRSRSPYSDRDRSRSRSRSDSRSPPRRRVPSYSPSLERRSARSRTRSMSMSRSPSPVRRDRRDSPDGVAGGRRRSASPQRSAR